MINQVRNRAWNGWERRPKVQILGRGALYEQRWGNRFQKADVRTPEVGGLRSEVRGQEGQWRDNGGPITEADKSNPDPR